MCVHVLTEKYTASENITGNDKNSNPYKSKGF